VGPIRKLIGYCHDHVDRPADLLVGRGGGADGRVQGMVRTLFLRQLFVHRPSLAILAGSVSLLDGRYWANVRRRRNGRST
jgi:hypothetical protein